MIRLVGLEDREPRLIAATGAADGLDKELEGPLGGPFVRQVQGDIGRHDADQGHLGDVEALRHERGPDEDIEPTLGEGIDDPLCGPLALDDVPVKAADPQRREAPADLTLDPLRAAAEVPDPGRGTSRAAGREQRGGAAVVAPQGVAGLVVHQRPTALRTGLDVTTVAAHDHRGRTAAVDDEDRPVAGPRVEVLEGLLQPIGQQAPVPGGELGAEVDELDDRWGAARPSRQPDATVLARPRPADAVHRRCRAAEHASGTSELG